MSDDLADEGPSDALLNVMRLRDLEANIECLAVSADAIRSPETKNPIETVRGLIHDLLPLLHEGRFRTEEVVDELAAALTDRGIAPREAEALIRRAIARRLSPGWLGALDVIRPADCAATDTRPYVVKHLLAERDVACIFGPPGAGKSLIGPALCYAVARGAPFFGHRTRQCGTLYVAAEDAHGMQKRVRALFQRHGDAPLFGLLGGISDLLSSDSPDLDNLLTTARVIQPGVIVIDTVAMAWPGLEENDAAGMGRVVSVARALAETGAAVILIHHDTKAGTGTPRGHSILNGALDVAMMLGAKDEGGIVRGKLTKNRNGSVDLDIAFRIGVDQVGVDQDGDPVTAAVMVEIACTPGPKLSASARVLSRVVAELQDECGSVDEAELRGTCDEQRSISTADKPDSRRRAFNRALSDSIESGVLSARGGRIWLESANSAFPPVPSGQPDNDRTTADLSGPSCPATPSRNRTDTDNTLRGVRCPVSEAARSPDLEMV